MNHQNIASSWKTEQTLETEVSIYQRSPPRVSHTNTQEITPLKEGGRLLILLFLHEAHIYPGRYSVTHKHNSETATTTNLTGAPLMFNSTASHLTQPWSPKTVQTAL